ncbi:hypothetical protein PFICI_08788 [Pestalotiopsis fici W106-1]|uniref:DUF7580 domain-containing protein n=1 Tax=Pestalotiopsis fici (strain W106-1 / CGMCC3.15140) TaxID=1229662 RepID=W3WYL0_PESFW|nr:uncharacterized protein PFICI_08788 [Pestalotiopsis fici W106-1]ETS78935.1 hypothetical protein PFICI_08788 [Pestalotiopsis fici W106-1]
MELARSLAKGIFAALRSTIVCACPVSHGINLQLTAFPTSLMAHGDEEMAAKRMMFQLALSFDPDNTGHDNAPWLWELVRLQLIDDKIVPTQAIFNGRPLKSNQKINKRARFATLSNAGQQQPNMDNTGTHHAFNSALALPMASGMQANDASPNISASCVHDLCGAIAKGQDKHNVHCYGYISDKSAVTAPMFGVYPFGQMPSPSCTVISLKDVLEDHGKTFPLLRFRHKVRLSHLFALSVLQLSSSPWMPKILTSRDIIFLRRDDNVLYESVYIASRLPYSSPDRLVFDDARVSPLVPNKELFFLGILLIELALGTTFDKLRSSVSEQRYTKPLDLEADWAMAINALSELQSTMKASPNYFKSVKVCIKCEFLHENIDLNDQIFRQEVYKRVVGPLEEDLLPLSF